MIGVPHPDFGETVVGVIVPDLNNPIYNELVRGIDETAEELGYHVLMSRTEHMEPGADFLRKLAGDPTVKAVVLRADSPGGDPLAAALAAAVEHPSPLG